MVQPLENEKLGVGMSQSFVGPESQASMGRLDRNTGQMSLGIWRE